MLMFSPVVVIPSYETKVWIRWFYIKDHACLLLLPKCTPTFFNKVHDLLQFIDNAILV